MTPSTRDTSVMELEPTTEEPACRARPRVDDEDVDMPFSPDFEDPALCESGAELPRTSRRPTQPATGASSAGHVEPEAEQMAIDVEPNNRCSPLALQQRLLVMMTGDGEHPVASGEPLVAPEATNELIVAAVKAFGPHIRGVWQ